MRSGIGPPGPSAETFLTAPISGGVGVEAGRVSRKSWRASLGDSVLYAGRPDLMTSLMTSCTWGSRAMALSSIHERTSAGGAPAPRRPAARTAMRLEHVVAATGLELARALGQGGRVDQALVGEQLLEGVQPALVVARGLALALGVA